MSVSPLRFEMLSTVAPWSTGLCSATRAPASLEPPPPYVGLRQQFAGGRPLSSSAAAPPPPVDTTSMDHVSPLRSPAAKVSPMRPEQRSPFPPAARSSLAPVDDDDDLDILQL